MPHPRYLSWQKKLLDLSRRNPLLNLPAARGLAVLEPGPAALFKLFEREDKRGISIGAVPFSEDGDGGALLFLREGERLQTEAAKGIGEDPTLTSETMTKKGKRRLSRTTASSDLREEIERWRAEKKVDVCVDSDPEDLQAQLSEMARTAKSKLEEGGVHTLYLALGLLEWRDSPTSPGSDAPAFLLPVSLVRTNARSPFRLADAEGEMTLNPTLATKLEQDFGVDLTRVKAALDDDASIEQLLILLKEAGSSHGMQVKNEARLGLFTFAKHHLWNDLQVRFDSVLAHPLVHAILEHDTLLEKDGPSVAWEAMDAAYAPTDLLTPLPADASQLRAIARVERGESMVIQGPPGTGKSQTITNLIAHALGKGKRVLFVSEKMNALNVVRSRLDAIGLGPYCLELHSTKLHKAGVVQQIRDAIEAKAPGRQSGWSSQGQDLQQQRVALNEALEALHEDRPLGMSLYAAIGRLAKDLSKARALPLALGDLSQRSGVDLLRLRKAAARAAEAMQNRPSGAAVFDVFSETPPEDDQQFFQALSSLRQALTRLAILPGMEQSPKMHLHEVQRLIQLRDHAALAPAAFGPELARPEARERAGAFLVGLEDFLEAWSPFRARLRECSSSVGASIVDAYAEAASSIWPLSLLKERGALRLLQARAQDGETLQKVDLVRFVQQWPDVQEKRAALIQADGHFRDTLREDKKRRINERALKTALEWWTENVRLRQGVAEWTQPGEEIPGKPEWAAEGSAQRANRAAAEQLAEIGRALAVLGALPPLVWGNYGGSEEITLGAMQSQAETWLGAQPLWPRWKATRGAVLDAHAEGLGLLVELLQSGERWTAAEASSAVERQWLETWINQEIARKPEILEWTGSRREEAIAQFAQIDGEFEESTQLEIVGRVHAAHQAKIAQHPQELALLKREFAKQTRHLPVRRLIQALPNILPELKPCFLMSPLSVAQFLPHEMPPFDLVIFDEASQIPIPDSVGAISRGKQVVVVGDPKQMPPGHLFEVAENEDDDEELAADDLRSILDECLATMQEVTLNWHYRSRHEDLIAFSNSRYYQGSLITFPTASTEAGGIVVHQVQGVYDRGASRTNLEEANAVVAAVARHFMEGSRQSVGVITFNQQQQRLIERLLDEAMRKSPALEQRMSGASEELFVKNLENVQGDERDIILFSTTFGKDSSGRFVHAFGPLAQLGGERRLNVAITRARQRLEIFTSFHPSDIDLSRVKHAGVRDLRDYLEFAHGGAAALAAVASPSLGIPDSPFEIAVATALRARGWQVQAQVGCSGYRIDLAVLHPSKPGRYLAGVECDGATYHSFKVARDRDRMRQKILEGLGWTILRIWSTDWFQQPGAEVDRIDQRLQTLLAEAELDP